MITSAEPEEGVITKRRGRERRRERGREREGGNEREREREVKHHTQKKTGIPLAKRIADLLCSKTVGVAGAP